MKSFKTEVETNLWDFYREVASLSGYEYGERYGNEFVWNRSGSWPAYILDKPHQKSVANLVKSMEEKELPPLWIMDHGGDKELVDGMADRGVRIIREWTGMVLHREDYMGSGMEYIVEVRTNRPEDLNTWLEIVNSDLMTGSQIDPVVPETFRKSKKFTWMVGYSGSQAVGTGLIFISEGIAGLYMIATRPNYRRRGIGTQITAKMIEHAFGLGAKRIILHATPAGESIYHRLSFREVNRFSIFLCLFE